MIRKEDTKLERFDFGDNPDDRFYCLVDLRVSPGGLDLEKMRLADPRNFDQVLRDMGCLAMLTGVEVEELERRGELKSEDLHNALWDLCRREGIIS